jgi:hypothetical protein
VAARRSSHEEGGPRYATPARSPRRPAGPRSCAAAASMSDCRLGRRCRPQRRCARVVGGAWTRRRPTAQSWLLSAVTRACPRRPRRRWRDAGPVPLSVSGSRRPRSPAEKLFADSPVPVRGGTGGRARLTRSSDGRMISATIRGDMSAAATAPSRTSMATHPRVRSSDVPDRRDLRAGRDREVLR